jgi:hypothetical protein
MVPPGEKPLIGLFPQSPLAGLPREAHPAAPGTSGGDPELVGAEKVGKTVFPAGLGFSLFRGAAGVQSFGRGLSPLAVGQDFPLLAAVPGIQAGKEGKIGENDHRTPGESLSLIPHGNNFMRTTTPPWLRFHLGSGWKPDFLQNFVYQSPKKNFFNHVIFSCKSRCFM